MHQPDRSVPPRRPATSLRRYWLALMVAVALFLLLDAWILTETYAGPALPGTGFSPSSGVPPAPAHPAVAAVDPGAILP